MPEFIVIATFNHIHETMIIRAKLDSEGIPSMVRNENFSYLRPMFATSKSGIQLEVIPLANIFQSVVA